MNSQSVMRKETEMGIVGDHEAHWRTLAVELAKVRFKRLVFEARVVTPMLLPPFKGSTLRGGFGRSLFDLCRQRGRLDIYRYIFATPIVDGSERLASCQEAPRPYVIEPPLDTRAEYAPGDTFEFSVLLVGAAAELVSWVADAFELLGQQSGLGKALHPDGRGRFELESVQLLPTKATGIALDPDGTNMARSPAKGGSCMAVSFVTPMRATVDERYATRPDFHVLIRNLLRRASNLAYFHCGNPLELDFRGIIQAAHQVELVENSTSWLDWERYSSRQGERLKLGGLIGQAKYEGDLEPFLPLLRFGEQLHAGKGVVFGLGLYRLGYPDREAAGKAKDETAKIAYARGVVTDMR